MLHIHMCHWWGTLVRCDSIWNKPLFRLHPSGSGSKARIAGSLQMKITGCQCLNGILCRAIWCAASLRERGAGCEVERERELRPIAVLKSNILPILPLAHCSAVIDGSLTMLSLLFFSLPLSLSQSLYLPVFPSLPPSAHLSGVSQQKNVNPRPM